MNRAKRIATALLLVLAVGCAGSIQKDAFNGLSTLKAGYQTAHQTVDAYCAPGGVRKAPVPQLCLDSFKPLDAAYTLMSEGTKLLAAYAQSATADIKMQLSALIPAMLNAGLDLVKLEQEMK